ncbi:hypothetical protein [Streptomyces sp. XD-27]|uniref:hypothetical protein n=1 Tax=Streptomyces sp. XD-27 TaxID=3062779 RepID=UPI0026F412B7|nr:hypothetical protein [Streptomyces sp. XD-27]WKX71973.1 hypothetical protein Q3Y56_20570 [Streptomyces sp. XD-27]
MLVTGVAACGVMEKISAANKLENAAEKLGERKSLAVEFDIDASAAQLVALSKKGPDAEPLAADEAKLMAGLRVTLAVQARKPIAEAGEKDIVSTRLAIAGPDGDLAEYRLIGKTAYYRADIKALAELSGRPAPSAEEIGGMLPVLPGSAADGIRTILDGGWIKIDTRKMESFTDGMEKAQREADGSAGDDAPSGPGDVDAETGEKVLKAIKGVFSREITIKDEGSRDGATHLVASGSARTLLTGVVGELRPIVKDLPGGSRSLPTAKELKELPDKKVSIDFSVKNGELAGATADIAPLVDDFDKGDKLPLTLTFGDAGKIGAPSGATEVDFDDLLGLAPDMTPEEAISGDNYTIGPDQAGHPDAGAGADRDPLRGIEIDGDDLEYVDVDDLTRDGS